MRRGVKIWAPKLRDILGLLDVLAALETGVLGVFLWGFNTDFVDLFWYIVSDLNTLFLFYLRVFILLSYYDSYEVRRWNIK